MQTILTQTPIELFKALRPLNFDLVLLSKFLGNNGRRIKTEGDIKIFCQLEFRELLASFKRCKSTTQKTPFSYFYSSGAFIVGINNSLVCSRV